MREHTGGRLGRLIRKNLTPDLLSTSWRKRLTGISKTEGHCYIASEAYYHLVGGREAGFKPCVISKDDWTHWFVMDKSGNIHDVTRSQFKGRPPYELARGSGFLTRKPSRRAQALIDKCQEIIW